MTPPLFAHGHLRLYLLKLLSTSDEGMHGYELIQALSEQFGGTYIPSAGTIYPRLAKLEEEGLVTKQADGRKTVYEITPAGRAELDSRASELDGIENDVTDSVRRLADEVRSSVNDAMRTLRADLAAASREARAEAKSAGRTMHADAAPDSSGTHGNLQQAEAAITQFRAAMRAELRTQSARGGTLSAEALAELRSGLDAVSRTVLDALKR